MNLILKNEVNMTYMFLSATLNCQSTDPLTRVCLNIDTTKKTKNINTVLWVKTSCQESDKRRLVTAANRSNTTLLIRSFDKWRIRDQATFNIDQCRLLLSRFQQQTKCRLMNLRRWIQRHSYEGKFKLQYVQFITEYKIQICKEVTNSKKNLSITAKVCATSIWQIQHIKYNNKSSSTI